MHIFLFLSLNYSNVTTLLFTFSGSHFRQDPTFGFFSSVFKNRLQDAASSCAASGSGQSYDISDLCSLICHAYEQSFEVPHPVASGATYEGRDRGVNTISAVTECDWHSKGCWRPVTSDSHAGPEG